jgi:hypothetical protein
MSENPSAVDPEIAAISSVHAALKDLDAEAQARVLAYVAKKLKVVLRSEKTGQSSAAEMLEGEEREVAESPRGSASEAVEDDLEGVSVVARRWMRRSGFRAAEIQRVFSLGGDEIELIANAVPGTNKKERMRSVFLLKGVAAYLASGAARFTHAQAKEACIHYDAFDSPNFATYFRSIASEVSGSRKAGYTLTARGLANATEMIRGMVSGS